MINALAWVLGHLNHFKLDLMKTRLKIFTKKTGPSVDWTLKVIQLQTQPPSNVDLITFQ